MVAAMDIGDSCQDGSGQAPAQAQAALCLNNARSIAARTSFTTCTAAIFEASQLA